MKAPGTWSFAYVAALVYASLYPFGGWPTATPEPVAFFSANWAADYSALDVLVNVLAYMPLGLLAALWWRRSGRATGALLFAGACGAAVSLAMELTQQLIPGRVASVIDLSANAAGTLIGATFARLKMSDGFPGRMLINLRQRWVRPGNVFLLGVGAIGLWALSQLTPLVPALSVEQVRRGVSALLRSVQDPERFNHTAWTVYALSIAGLALLASTLGNPGRRIVCLFFAFVAVVLTYKMAVPTRQLSLEALLGAISALFIAPMFLGLRGGSVACVSAILILSSFVCAELAPGQGGRYHAFGWAPSGMESGNVLNDVVAILEIAWPAGALAYVARLVSPPVHRQLVAWLGAVALGALTFALEWYQQFLPGRYGQITTVILVLTTWAAFHTVRLDEEPYVTSESGLPLRQAS
jgi:VanZ family protein